MLILLADHESLDCIQSSECFVHWFANRQRATHCRCNLPGLLWLVIHKISLLDTKFIFSRRMLANDQGSYSLRKKKKRWNMSEQPKGGRLLPVTRTHMGYELFCNALTKCSTPWRQVVCWGSLLANQQCFLLKPRHCASSSLLHSCEHCVDPRTQYYFASILDRVPN